MKTINNINKFNISITRSRDLHISPALPLETGITNRLFKSEGGEVLPINNNNDIVGVLYDTHQTVNFAEGTEFSRLGTVIARVEGVHVVAVETDRVFRFDAGDKKKSKKSMTPEEQVLAALDGDTLTMAEVIEETGLENGEVRSLLRKLVDAGTVLATKQGTGSKAKNAYALAAE